MKKLVLTIVIVLAISVRGRNLGGFSGNPDEPSLNNQNDTETETDQGGSPSTASSQESSDGTATQQLAAPLSPWSAWMQLRAPPAAYVIPKKKKPIPSFLGGPGPVPEAQPSPTAGVEAPWVSWTKLKAPPAFAPPSVPGLPSSLPVILGTPAAAGGVVEAPWVSWTKLKAPPAFVSMPVQSGESSEVTSKKLKAPLAASASYLPDSASVPASENIPAAKEESTLYYESGNSVPLPESRGYFPQPSIAETFSGPTQADIETAPLNLSKGTDLLKAFLSKYLLSTTGEKLDAENVDKILSSSVEGVVPGNPNPSLNLTPPEEIYSPFNYSPSQAEISPLNPFISSVPSAPRLPISQSETFIPEVSQSVSPYEAVFPGVTPPVLLPPETFSPKLSNPNQIISGPLPYKLPSSSLPTSSPGLTSIPLTISSDGTPSILPEQIPALLAWLQTDSAKTLAEKPLLPTENIQKIPSVEEKSPVLSPTIAEYIKLLQEAEVPPNAIPPVSPFAKPQVPADILGPVTPSLQPVYPQSPVSPAYFPVSKFASPKYPVPAPISALPVYAKPVLSPLKLQTPASVSKSPEELYAIIIQMPWLAELLKDSVEPTPLTPTTANTSLAVAEEKLLVKWAKKIFEMQKNSTFAPKNKTSILESAWIDWLKLHNLTGAVTALSPTEAPATEFPIISEVEVAQLVNWLEKIDAVPTNPEEVKVLVEWLEELKASPTVASEPPPVWAPVPPASAQIIPPEALDGVVPPPTPFQFVKPGEPAPPSLAQFFQPGEPVPPSLAQFFPPGVPVAQSVAKFIPPVPPSAAKFVPPGVPVPPSAATFVPPGVPVPPSAAKFVPPGLPVPPSAAKFVPPGVPVSPSAAKFVPPVPPSAAKFVPPGVPVPPSLAQLFPPGQPVPPTLAQFFPPGQPVPPSLAQFFPPGQPVPPSLAQLFPPGEPVPPSLAQFFPPGVLGPLSPAKFIPGAPVPPSPVQFIPSGALVPPLPVQLVPPGAPVPQSIPTRVLPKVPAVLPNSKLPTPTTPILYLEPEIVEAINEVLTTGTPEAKAYLQSWLLDTNISLAPVPKINETPEKIPASDVAPTPPVGTVPIAPTAELAQWIKDNLPDGVLESVISAPTESPISSELQELTPAQFSILLKKVLEQCNKTSIMVPRSSNNHNNHRNNHDSSEEVEDNEDRTDQKRALLPVPPSTLSVSPSSAPPSKLDFIPQEFWDMVPTVAPDTTILDPGYWAAKKSMFISKLFDALAKVTLNYTNSATTTESPKDKLIKQIDTVLLSDAARSIKAKDEDSEETSTDDEDLINSEEPANLPKEPENPLHKLFKFGVQKTILSDLSTTQPPTVPTTTTPAPTTPSLDKQKLLLLDKLKSAYHKASHKSHRKKSKKAKSKPKKFRGSTTTSGPIDFEELAKALLVQPD